MTTLEFSLLVWIGSFSAGLLGALTGLGGGVVIVPLLTSVFGVDIRYAVGASLVSVIATSLGAASTYIKKGYTNLRLGMFLEVATTIGAIAGAMIATFVSVKALTIVLAIVLIYSAYLSQRPRIEHAEDEATEFRSPLGIVKAVLSGSDAYGGLRLRSIIQFGLLLLIAIPILRVFISLLAFLIQREFIYVIVTLLVMTSLIYSLVGAYY
ncbi:TSUP family transporter [Nostoc sp.]